MLATSKQEDSPVKIAIDVDDRVMIEDTELGRRQQQQPKKKDSLLQSVQSIFATKIEPEVELQYAEFMTDTDETTDESTADSNYKSTANQQPQQLLVVENDTDDDCGTDENDDASVSENENTAEEDPYVKVMGETISSAGRWAFGIAAIEIWVETQDDKRGMILERARCGWWRDRVFEESDALRKLEESDNESIYVPLEPLIPGLGVAGTLLSEVRSGEGKLTWRDLRQLADDPDQPRDNGRLALLAEVFGIATGVPFHCRVTGLKGLVVFYARRSANFEKLSSEKNQAYLRSSANLLGAVVSWEQPRLDAVAERKSDLAAVIRRVRIKILALSRFGMLSAIINKNEQEKNSAQQNENNRSDVTASSGRGRPKITASLRRSSLSLASYGKKKTTRMVKKMKGGGQMPPPPMSLSQCLFAFCGCFLSLLSLSAVNESIKSSGNDTGILLAPLGALVTMHYGLTSAPASQPRNSFLGIMVATIISKSISYIPEYILPVWVRIAVGPAFAIVATLKLGVIHPPAGAVAVVFAADSASNDWASFGLLLAGYAMAIIFALFFVNLNGTKTFPVYWGVPDTREWWSICKRKLKDLQSSKQTDKKAKQMPPRNETNIIDVDEESETSKKLQTEIPGHTLCSDRTSMTLSISSIRFCESA